MTAVKSLVGLMILLCGISVLTGCGQMGPLALPDQSAEADDESDEENER